LAVGREGIDTMEEDGAVSSIISLSPGREASMEYEQRWAAILQNVSIKAIQIHNF
jgi:hypothetical protein